MYTVNKLEIALNRDSDKGCVQADVVTNVASGYWVL